MKSQFQHKGVSALSAIILLAVPAKAFEPYYGAGSDGPTTCDLVYDLFVGGLEVFERPKPTRVRVTDRKAVAKAVKTGGPFDARVSARCNDPDGRLRIMIDLKEDGTASWSMDGNVVAGKARRSRGARPGSRVGMRSRASGTWTLGAGVRTFMTFSGRTNGVPTTVTAVMDLTPANKINLDLRLRFKRNRVFSGPATIKFR